MTKKITNRQIVEELKEGDSVGCRHLVDVYKYRLFDHLTDVFHLPREDAEEMVDDVLLMVVQRIDRFSFRSSDLDFARWIFTILRNTVRDYFRRRNRTAIEWTGYDEAGLRGDSDEGTREVYRIVVSDFLLDKEPEDEHSGNRRPLDILTSVLQSMQSWERVLLRCRAMGIPYEEIAPYVDKPVNQLKTYHLRARKRFSSLVREEFEREGFLSVPGTDMAGPAEGDFEKNEKNDFIPEEKVCL